MALNNRQTKKQTRIKTIKAHKPSSQQLENVRPSNTEIFSFLKNQFQRTDEEMFVPLAAKDSGWIDLQFHDTSNINYNQINGDADADDEVTIEISETGESRQQSPMVLLFPNLSDVDLAKKTSPTDITKLLVGQKVNTKYFKPAKKPHFSQVSIVTKCFI